MTLISARTIPHLSGYLLRLWLVSRMEKALTSYSNLAPYELDFELFPNLGPDFRRSGLRARALGQSISSQTEK